MRPIRVSELSFYMERILKKDAILQKLEVEGEITNVRRSRFLYFDLKDQKALLHCVSFDPKRDFSLAKEGDQALVQGRISLYHLGGRIQLTVSGIRSAGLGEDALRLCALKEKLQREGLFDPDNKKPLPEMPKVIGLITSATGAVLHDFANEANRRFPLVKILFENASVQGQAAPAEIIRAMDDFEQYHLTSPIDLIVIARGGGSGEDLSCFNNEALVRRVFQSPIPVISAIGHQVDYTLLDLVSDRRASTPTEAANLALPDQLQLAQSLDDLQRSIWKGLHSKIREKRLFILKEEKEIEALHPSRRISAERRALENGMQTIEQKFQELIIRKRKNLQERSLSISKTFSQKVEEVNQRLKISPLPLSLYSLEGKTIEKDKDILIGKTYQLQSKDYAYQILIKEKERKAEHHE